MCYKKIFNYIVIIGILAFIVLATTLSSSINADDYVDPTIFGGGVSNSSSSTSTSSTFNSGNTDIDIIINSLYGFSSSTSSSSSSGSMSNGFCKVKMGTERYCKDCGPCDEGQGMCFINSDCKSGLVCNNGVCAISSGGGDCRIQEGTLTYCAACGPCSEGQSVCHKDSQCVSGLVCSDNGYCVKSSNPSSSSSSGGAGCRIQEGTLTYCEVCGPCSEDQSVCFKDSECASGLVCNSKGFCVRSAPSGTCKATPGSERYCTDCGPCEEGQGMCFNDSQCKPPDLVCSNYTCIKIIRESAGGDCRLTPPTNGYCNPEVCGPCKEGGGWCRNPSIYKNDCEIGLICNNNGFCVKPSPPLNDNNNNNNNCQVPVGSATYCTDCGPCREGQGKCSKDTDCIKGLVCSEHTGLCKKP
jgi:hypothetical protein